MTKEDTTMQQKCKNSNYGCNSAEQRELCSQTIRIGLQRGEFEWGYAICDTHGRSKYVYITKHD